MYSAVILAAGRGSRAKLGYNKMLYEVDGRAIIYHTTKIFVESGLFSEIIIVINRNDEAKIRQILSEFTQVRFTYGSDERMNSVYNGVNIAKSQQVFVHDGARVYITKELLKRLERKSQQVANCALAVPAIDTTLVVQDGEIKQVLDRQQLYNMQTPQVVLRDQFISACERAIEENLQFSDEMSLLSHYNYQCHIVESEYSNVKLTKPEDFKE